MAKKTKNEKENFKDMKPADLNKKLAEFRENIRVLKFKGQGSKSKNVKESGTLRKEVARILTELNAK